MIHAQNEYKAEKFQQNVWRATVGVNFFKSCNGTVLQETMFGKGFAQQAQGTVQDAGKKYFLFLYFLCFSKF